MQIRLFDLIFETGSYFVASVVLELTEILLSQPHWGLGLQAQCILLLYIRDLSITGFWLFDRLAGRQTQDGNRDWLLKRRVCGLVCVHVCTRPQTCGL